ncbi:glutamate receptor ionotropic, kainate 2-like isoform X1 [Mytilus trossulus]|uniref:glutamate receptor ionotropic, kainate 2-like isoform X1 n=2 Tax=Mytilus trossulus TaxID=6551 RepID=UPI003007EE31
MRSSNFLVFLFGLPILSHQTVILKIGVISSICGKTNSSEGKNTSLTYKPTTYEELTAEIFWKFVNVTEEFQVLLAVTELYHLDLDCIVIAANVQIPEAVANLIKIPVIDWGKDKVTNLSTPVTSTDGCQMTTPITTIAPNECTLPEGIYKYQQEPLFNNVTGAAITLISVIVHLKWSSVCIVFDNDTEHEAMRLHHGLSDVGIFADVHSLQQMTSQKIDSLMKEKAAVYDETSLNCTILCRLESCQQYLEKPFDYGRKHMVRSSLLHNSRWLLGIFHDGDISVLETNSSTELDNVAVIQYPTSLLNEYQQNELKLEDAVKNVFMHMSELNDSNTRTLTEAAIEGLYDIDSDEFKYCAWLPIQTLLWHTRKRGFSNVGYTQLTGSLSVSKNIYPNAKFGFNRRKFIVSSLPWNPFVVLDNETHNYTGFTIDLLQELAHGLNFTYEMTAPSDGQWGIEGKNKSWTGLVGQLQRRDVDIVAAPLSIQTDRERVIDFTYPYFYESSAILMKKPDPNLTKWRTLIDPFSTTVLLCIFVSLPICSFFLFFFEKYNPYYRKVEDRSKVRGLHHFSDSFWYMYGALLTQGGEHMADSSSGRTLLSFWWIFCIIMMATYSGNLIAFLTVTKDKLPFTDLSGLVAQDKYEWGTQGGSVFEHIFKTSTLPEYQTLWNGIVGYNQTDNRVLSVLGNVQIEKVIEGDYAYIGDKTYFDMIMVNNCDLAMTLAEILQLQYAIALPNNSPFTKMFSDEIISIHESGLLQIWKLRHWPKPGFCKGSLLKEPKAITLIDVQSAFYMIGIGIFVASFTLFIEFLKQTYCKWREKIGKAKEKPQTIRHVSTIPKLDEFISY